MFTLRAKLAHLAIVSWAVPAERLAELLPSQLVPNTIDDAGKIGVFSMAAMRDTTLDESYAQLNERTYVRRRDGTGEGAFFWKSHAASRQADLFRWLLGIPEFHDAVDLTFDDGTGVYECTYGSYIDDGDKARVVLRIATKGRGSVPERYRRAGLDLRKAWRISKNPMIGYTLDWGELCETSVRHDEIKGRPVRVEFVDPSFMVPSMTLDRGQAREPMFAAYQPETPFYIAMPPRPVEGWWRLLSRLFMPGRA